MIFVAFLSEQVISVLRGLVYSFQTSLSYLQLYKNVAERGEWSSILESARKAYVDRKISQAVLQYSFAAELGYEVAQSNVAFLLDRGRCPVPGHTVPKEKPQAHLHELRNSK